MANPPRDLVEQYRLYLQRFEQEVGPCEFGAYAKHRGRLIKKMQYDEFDAKWQEFQEIDQAYADILNRGDTINDVIVKVLRERCDELLLERKV